MSRIANDTAKISLPESWTNVPNKQELDEVENRLQKNITDGDTTLQNNLDAAEATLQGNIDTEVARAKAKELELQNKFNSYTPTLDIPAIKVDNAVNADAATKATQDGNGKDIAATYAKVENTYNKDEVDQKVSSVYTYKGSVATKAELPTQDLTIGDVYDVKDSGINYAWNGTSWDALGMEIDLNLYAKKTDVPGIKVNNASLADEVKNDCKNQKGETLVTIKESNPRYFIFGDGTRFNIPTVIRTEATATSDGYIWNIPRGILGVPVGESLDDYNWNITTVNWEAMVANYIIYENSIALRIWHKTPENPQPSNIELLYGEPDVAKILVQVTRA